MKISGINYNRYSNQSNTNTKKNPNFRALMIAPRQKDLIAAGVDPFVAEKMHNFSTLLFELFRRNPLFKKAIEETPNSIAFALDFNKPKQIDFLKDGKNIRTLLLKHDFLELPIEDYNPLAEDIATNLRSLDVPVGEN